MQRTDTQTPSPASPDPSKKPVTPMKPGSGLRPASNVTIPASGAKPVGVSGGGSGGASRPPTTGEHGGGGGGRSGGGATPAPTGGMPPIDQLQGRPNDRVL